MFKSMRIDLLLRSYFYLWIKHNVTSPWYGNFKRKTWNMKAKKLNKYSLWVMSLLTLFNPTTQHYLMLFNDHLTTEALFTVVICKGTCFVLYQLTTVLHCGRDPRISRVISVSPLALVSLVLVILCNYQISQLEYVITQ